MRILDQDPQCFLIAPKCLPVSQSGTLLEISKAFIFNLLPNAMFPEGTMFAFEVN